MRRHVLVTAALVGCAPEPEVERVVVQRTVTDVVYLTGSTNGTPTTDPSEPSTDPLDKDADGVTVDVDCDDLDPSVYLPDEPWEGDLLPSDFAAFCEGYCTRSVTGSVDVGEQRKDLEDLRCLSEVGWSLLVDDNEHIASLEPLSNLRRVGGAVILGDLPEVDSLTGLEALTDAGSLVVEGLPLVDLEPLSGLSFVGYLRLSRLDGLENLVGLEGLWFAASVDLNELNALTSLQGLAPVNLAKLELQHLPALSAVDLSVPVTEYMWLEDLPITALPDHSQWSRVREVYLVSLDQLTEPLQHEEEPGLYLDLDVLFVNHCDSVEYLLPANAFSMSVDDLTVRDSGGLLGLVEPFGLTDVRVEKATIENNASLHTVEGLELSAWGLPWLNLGNNDALLDLHGLVVSSNVLSYVSLHDNESLVDVSALHAAEQIVTLHVSDNPSLSQGAVDALVAEAGAVVNLIVEDNGI